MIVYGSMLCPDCVECCEAYDAAGVDYTFLNITEGLRELKAFLKLRDICPDLETLRGGDTIGIPCVVLENGSVTLDWASVLEKPEA